MKGFSEQRGVQSRVSFDADKGQFVQRDEVHDFVAAMMPRVAHPPEASIIDLASHGKAVKAAPRSRKARVASAPSRGMARTG